MLSLFLCFLTSVYAQQAYYFSTSALASDSNSGKDPSLPWRSLAMAKTIPRDSSNSFAVLLERGTVFYDETLRVEFIAGGVVGDYGNVSLPQPTIMTLRGAQPAPVWGASGPSCVELIDPDRTTIQNLHMKGCWTGLSLVFSPNARPRANITVTGCAFSDINAPYGSIDPSSPAWGRGIAVSGGGLLTNLTIRNNVAIRTDVFVTTPNTVNYLWLDSNTVERCGGNCVDLEANNMHLLNSVFLRDSPEQIFLYGTTDVIIGSVAGDNSIENNDFNARGEYEAAPDGCAIDFETAAQGFRVVGNTLWRSWGAGVMVFGHDATSTGLTFENNAFLYAGCIQPRGDQASMAIMCPNGHIPSGEISNNWFVTCPEIPPIFVNPSVPGCGDQMKQVGNRVNLDAVVAMPELTFNPVDPADPRPSVFMPVLAVCTTPNAVLRYTLDGSRPTESSPVMPAAGIQLSWPGPVIAVNVKAFVPGMIPSITNGVIVERSRYVPIPLVQSSAPRSAVDGISINPTTGEATVVGWVVDPTNNGSWGSSSIVVRTSYHDDVHAVANMSRPDLVTAGVAPNPQHGFSVNIGKVAGVENLVDVLAYQAAWATREIRVNGAPLCICNGAPCQC